MNLIVIGLQNGQNLKVCELKRESTTYPSFASSICAFLCIIASITSCVVSFWRLLCFVGFTVYKKFYYFIINSMVLLFYYQ